MKSLKRLWIVTYRKKEYGTNKISFYQYYDDTKRESEYFIKNHEQGINHIPTTMNEGNELYKELLKYDRKAVVNKIC